MTPPRFGHIIDDAGLSHGYIDANNGGTLDVDSPTYGIAGEQIGLA
jgi:hypothetical protein